MGSLLVEQGLQLAWPEDLGHFHQALQSKWRAPRGSQVGLSDKIEDTEVKLQQGI
jgi:hypothetical protein